MAKVALNKSALKKQRDDLALYKKFLPSLDLKRKQLLTELKENQRQLAELEEEIEQLEHDLGELFALLGGSRLELSDLVQVKDVDFDRQNVVGAKLPVLSEVHFEVEDYSLLSRPFWVDFLVERWKQMAKLLIRKQVQEERVRRLQHAVRRTTQRVNLFDKVLIPRAEENIKRIQIALADQERSRVVRSKIAKGKHLD